MELTHAMKQVIDNFQFFVKDLMQGQNGYKLVFISSSDWIPCILCPISQQEYAICRTKIYPFPLYYVELSHIIQNMIVTSFLGIEERDYILSLAKAKNYWVPKVKEGDLISIDDFGFLWERKNGN